MPARMIGQVLLAALLVVVGAAFVGGPAAGAAECVEWTTVTIETFGQWREIDRCRLWVETTGDSDDVGGGGGAAPGGGGGGTSTCQWVAAIEGLAGEVVPSVYERATADGVIETRFFTDCGEPQWLWVPAGTDPTNLVPQVTPQMLLPEAYARVRRQLPTPIPRIAPADLAPDGYAFVQMPAFFWVDQGPGQWEPVTATAGLAGLSLTMTATPSMLLVDTGDGATLQCASAPPYPEGTDPEQFDGCEHVYADSSAMAPNGETFEVTVTIVWDISWEASNGESGILAPLTTSANRDLPVAEIQAVVVDR